MTKIPFLHGFRALVAGACTLLAGASFNAMATGMVEIDDSFLADLQAAEAEQQFRAFVHFHGGDAASRKAVLDSVGLQVGKDYGSFTPARFVIGGADAFLALTTHPTVRYIEQDVPLRYFGETAVWASRARVAQEPVAGGPYYDRDGNVLDGAGISIAVIDSGVDGTHPDFEGRVSHSFKFVCSTPGLIATSTDQCFGEFLVGDDAVSPMVDLGPGANSDVFGGHGTHVAGIAAGSGAASTGSYLSETATPNVQGTYTGVAPGANIVAYSIGDGVGVGSAVNAYAHLIENYDDINPPVRVTNNSYGTGGGPANPGGMLAAAARALTAKGVVIAFAAGNDGGDGTTIQTSPTCNDATPGVICVASQDDQNTGDASAALSGFSSRGLADDATTHPDIAATGSNYTASCTQVLQPSQAVCSTGLETSWQPRYGTISGTSMATPHVAGAVALILQARPELSAAQVEKLLQDTARKNGNLLQYIDDPQNPGNTTHFGWGAGMLDVQAALDALGVNHAGDGGAGQATLAIASPMEGDTVDAGAPVTVSGTLNDGQGSGGLPNPVHVIGGDLDAEIPGAADITDVHIGITESGIRVAMTVRDATDFGPDGVVSLRLQQFVDGFNAVSQVALDAEGASPSTSTVITAAASNVALDGNTVSFDVGFDQLGDPADGSIGQNVVALSYINLLVDAAPSTEANAAIVTQNAQPMVGRPYTIVRPGDSEAPMVQVRVSVNGGDEQDAEVTGASPEYIWQLPSANGLVEGANTLTATLLLDGIEADAATVGFMLEGEQLDDPTSVSVVAALTGTTLEDGLTVALDARGSHACLDADCAATTTDGLSFAFHVSDDTNPEQGVINDADGVIEYTYGAAGEFQPFVVVTDASGNSSFDLINVTTTTSISVGGPGVRNAARLTADYDRDNPTVPLQVVLDASQTTVADGFEITQYAFEFGDGSAVTTTSATVQHVYTAAGNYAPEVTVTFTATDDATKTQTSTAKSNTVVRARVPGEAAPANASAPVSAGGGSGGLGWLLLAPLALAGLRRRTR